MNHFCRWTKVIPYIEIALHSSVQSVERQTIQAPHKHIDKFVASKHLVFNPIHNSYEKFIDIDAHRAYKLYVFMGWKRRTGYIFL